MSNLFLIMLLLFIFSFYFSLLEFDFLLFSFPYMGLFISLFSRAKICFNALQRPAFVFASLAGTKKGWNMFSPLGLFSFSFRVSRPMAFSMAAPSLSLSL